MTDRRRRTGPVVIRPLVDFLHTEAAGGLVLVIAALVALAWASSPWKAGYVDLWHTRLAITLGSHGLDLDLRDWVNDGLMTLFFLVVGLEIKRELVEGELREPRRAALPVIAAVGGMALPALLYIAVNAGGHGAAGWGIPMATDIAMAVGVMSLLGSRVDRSLKLFLLALAIVDDIGAILIIAAFYSEGVELPALFVALGLVGAVAVLRAAGVRATWAYVFVGAGLWLALHESGLHATLAGVVLGLMAPARPLRRRELIDETALRDLSTPEAARETATLARESVSVVEWLEHVLHPWTSFVIVPLFALANAGIPLDATVLSNAAGSRVTLGVVVGLVVGKTIGITAFTWAAVRARIGVLPSGARWIHVVGVAALGGIGFTVSIFVAGLAFEDATPLGAALQDEAKVGILAASLVAALLGTLILTRVRPGLGADRPDGRAKPQSGTSRGTTGERSTSGGR